MHESVKHQLTWAARLQATSMAISQCVALAFVLGTLASLTACGSAAEASCSSQLNALHEQMQWRTPGVGLRDETIDLIQAADRADRSDDEARCRAILKELNRISGVH